MLNHVSRSDCYYLISFKFSYLGNELSSRVERQKDVDRHIGKLMLGWKERHRIIHGWMDEQIDK